MQAEFDGGLLFRLFESVLPTARWKVVEGEAKAQIYSLRVVVWMMLLQRLDERGTQQRAVHEIAQGHLERLLPESKRVREGRIWQNTGGSRAPAGGFRWRRPSRCAMRCWPSRTCALRRQRNWIVR